jgi:hypothetical protein
MRLQASTCFLMLLRARVTLLPQGGPLSSRLVPAGLDYIDGLQIGPHNVRSGRVEDGRGSLGPMANAPFPIPAHQTGQADFRHPAFRLASPQRT